MLIRKNVCPLNFHLMTTLSDYWLLPKKDKDKVLQTSVNYLFRFINTKEFKTNLAKLNLDKKEIIKSQRSITTKGVLTKDLKLYLLQKAAGIKTLEIGELRKIYHVLEADQLSKIKKLSKNSILCKKELDSLILRALDACKPYVAKFVRKKMTFLIKTGRHDYAEICSQLLLEGLQSLLFMYPRFESELHAINILKHSIKNIGQNYIETHTRQKRNDYADAHTLRVNSIYVPDTNNLITMDNEDDCTENINEVSQLEVDVSEILTKSSGSNLAAIKLLMGEYDKDFTDYLNNNSVTKHSNDLYFEQCNTERYIAYVFKYLNFSKDEGASLLKVLRKKLKTYK